MIRLKFVFFVCLCSSIGVLSKPNFNSRHFGSNDISVFAHEKFDHKLSPKPAFDDRVKNETPFRGKRSVELVESDVIDILNLDSESNLEIATDRSKRTLELDPALFSKSETPDEIIDVFDIETYLQSQPELHKVFSPSNPDSVTYRSGSPIPIVDENNVERITKVKQPILVIPRPVIVEHYEQPILVVHKSLPIVQDIYDDPTLVESEIKSIIVEQAPVYDQHVAKRSVQFYQPVDSYNCVLDKDLEVYGISPVVQPGFYTPNDFRANLLKRDASYEVFSESVESIEADALIKESFAEDVNPPLGVNEQTDFFHSPRNDNSHGHLNSILSNIYNYSPVYPTLMTATISTGAGSKFEYFETGTSHKDHAVPAMTHQFAPFVMTSPTSSPCSVQPSRNSWQAVMPRFQQELAPCVSAPTVIPSSKCEESTFEIEKLPEENALQKDSPTLTDLKDDESLFIDSQEYSKDSVEDIKEPQKRSSRPKEKLKTVATKGAQEIHGQEQSPSGSSLAPEIPQTMSVPVLESVTETLLVPSPDSEPATGSLPVSEIVPHSISESATQMTSDQTVGQAFQTSSVAPAESVPQTDYSSSAVVPCAPQAVSSPSAESSSQAVNTYFPGGAYQTTISNPHQQKVTKILFQPYAQRITRPRVYYGTPNLSYGGVQSAYPAQQAVVIDPTMQTDVSPVVQPVEITPSLSESDMEVVNSKPVQVYENPTFESPVQEIHENVDITKVEAQIISSVQNSQKSEDDKQISHDTNTQTMDEHSTVTSILEVDVQSKKNDDDLIPQNVYAESDSDTKFALSDGEQNSVTKSSDRVQRRKENRNWYSGSSREGGKFAFRVTNLSEDSQANRPKRMGREKNAKNVEATKLGAADKTMGNSENKTEEEEDQHERHSVSDQEERRI